MILAAILLAALDTRSAYQFVDVSGIAVTGGYQAVAGEPVRGEHVARFYEWLGESRWMLESCDGYVKSLHELSMPTPHEITASFAPAFAAYSDTMATNSAAAVKFVIGDATPDSYECFSATYEGELSSVPTTDIANAAWVNFCSSSPRGGKSDYSAYSLPYACTMPSISSGGRISAQSVNAMNVPNTDTSYLYEWKMIGANRTWKIRDGGYVTLTQYGEEYTFGAPMWYEQYYVESVQPEESDDWLHKFESTSSGGLKHPNIIRGSGRITLDQYFTIEYTAAETPTLRSSAGSEIVGRTGITVDSKSMVIFFCCWKTGDESMNVKVMAKRYWFGVSSIDSLAEEVEAATSMPDGEYQTSYVMVMFVAHGLVSFSPNAFR